MDFKETLGGIDEALEKIIKSENTDAIEDEEKEETDEFVEKSEYTEEAQEDEVVETDDEFDEEEEIIETDDDEDEYMEMDQVVEAVKKSLLKDLNLIIDEKISPVVEILGKQAQATDIVMNKSQSGINDLEKSMKEIGENLDKINNMGLRKSVQSKKDINIQDKFENKTGLEDLSKAQVATILSQAIESGDRTIGIQDVTNAELGGAISDAARNIIKKSIQ